MTWPQCRAGEMSLAGVFSAPWPSFVAVCRRDHADAVSSSWASVLATMGEFTRRLLEARAPFVAQVAERFSLPGEEVEAWLARTTFKPSLEVSTEGLAHCVDELTSAGVLAARVEVSSLVIAPATLV